MTNNPLDRLHPNCLADLTKDSGLCEPIIQEARIELARPADISKETGINCQSITSAYRIPYFNSDGEVLSYQHKVLPSITTSDGRVIKYIQPKGTPSRPYILPRMWDVKDKQNKPMWFTEGVKKVLKLVQHGENAIGVNGVWNFKAGKDSMFDYEKTSGAN